MKKLHLLFLACAAAALSAYAAVPAAQAPAGVALCYVTAPHAFTVIKQKLGATATDAVSSVDEKQNVIVLDATHSQAPIVRAFLIGLDQRPPEVRVEATITRRLEATAAFPARDEVLSSRTILAQAGRPETFSIPGDRGTTEIELRVTPIGK
jgi:hypothetical protein